MAVKVLWFSRHEMSAEQKQALIEKLGEIEVIQVNGTAPNVHVPFEAEINGTEKTMVKPLKEWVSEVDVVAIVAPITIQQQILSVAGNKPVIMSENAREFVEGEKVVFRFVRWFRIVKIEVVTEDFMPERECTCGQGYKLNEPHEFSSYCG